MVHLLLPLDFLHAPLREDRARPEAAAADACYRSEAFAEDLGFEPTQPARLERLERLAGLLAALPLAVALASALLPVV